MKQTVIVSGASSQLGVFLLPRLHRAGYTLLALSRRAPDHPVEVRPGVSWVSATGLLDLPQALASADFMVSCGPLELAAQLLGLCGGVNRVVAFSSSSIFSKQHSADEGERAQIGGMVQQERALRRACGRQGTPLLLLRPTLIYGCGMDRNISLLARIGQRLGVLPVAGEARGLRQPVHADDLSSLALAALESAAAVDTDSTACGGSTLTYREMAGLAMAAVCGKSRTLAVPPALLVGMVRLLSQFPRWRSLNVEMVHRQAVDLVFDDSVLRDKLNYCPREFAPGYDDFAVPAAAQQLQWPPESEAVSSDGGT